jgi:hypothetical protein
MERALLHLFFFPRFENVQLKVAVERSLFSRNIADDSQLVGEESAVPARFSAGRGS